MGVAIHCPRCDSANVSSHQWTSGRRVVDIEDYFVLVTRTFKCEACAARRATQEDTADEEEIDGADREVQAGVGADVCLGRSRCVLVLALFRGVSFHVRPRIAWASAAL